MKPSQMNIEARNDVIDKIEDIMYSASIRELKNAYVIFHSITTYIESDPHNEKKHVLSLLRYISSNIIMLRLNSESSSESDVEKN